MTENNKKNQNIYNNAKNIDDFVNTIPIIPTIIKVKIFYIPRGEQKNEKNEKSDTF